jgi:hypothetical protein
MIISAGHISLTRGLKAARVQKVRGGTIVPTRRQKDWMEEPMPGALQLIPWEMRSSTCSLTAREIVRGRPRAVNGLLP